MSGFNENYNARPHSTLKESPDERFQREKAFLKGVPHIEPTILYERPLRKVSNDGYISWDGALYPVSMRYCLKDVRIETEFGKKLMVYDMSGQQIAEHPVRLFDKGIGTMHPEHEEINEAYRKKKETYRAERVKKFIETFQQVGNLYVEGLKTAVTANMYWHIDEIMRYTVVYNTEDVAVAISECIEIGAYHKNSVMRLLQCRQPNRKPINIVNQPYITPPVDIRRSLADYKVSACAGAEGEAVI